MLKNIIKFASIYYIFNLCLSLILNINIIKDINNPTNFDKKIIESILFSGLLIFLIKKKYIEGMTQYKYKKK
jgi:hypothetical protein